MPYTIENGYTTFHCRAVARLLEVGWLTVIKHAFGREVSEKISHTCADWWHQSSMLTMTVFREK